MKHIVTKCAEEDKARKQYKDVKAESAVEADKELETMVRELLALRHKMDDDELKASQMKAVIMEAMKEHELLKAKDGTVLAKWSLGSVKKQVNYDAIFKKYKVTPQDLEANTKFGRASRTFEIDPDEVMDK